MNSVNKFLSIFMSFILFIPNSSANATSKTLIDPNPLFSKIKTSHNLFEFAASVANPQDREFLLKLIRESKNENLPKMKIEDKKIYFQGLSDPFTAQVLNNGSVKLHHKGKTWTQDTKLNFEENTRAMAQVFWGKDKSSVQNIPFYNNLIKSAYAEETDEGLSYLNHSQNEIEEEAARRKNYREQSTEKLEHNIPRFLSGVGLVILGVGVVMAAPGLFKLAGLLPIVGGNLLLSNSASAEDAPTINQIKCHSGTEPLSVSGTKKDRSTATVRVQFKNGQPVRYSTLDNNVEVMSYNLKDNWQPEPNTLRPQRTKLSSIDPEEQAEILSSLSKLHSICKENPEQIKLLNKAIANAFPDSQPQKTLPKTRTQGSQQ